MLQTKRHFLSVFPCMLERSRAFLPAASSFAPFSEPYLAEMTPGAPPRASTQMPESSAITGSFTSSYRAFALTSAFPAKVFSVSSGSNGIPSSAGMTTVCAASIRASSSRLWAFPDAKYNFMMG